MPDAEPLPPSTSPPLHLPLPHPSSSKSGHPQRTHQLVPAQYRDISDSSDKNDTGDPDPDELEMVQNGHDKIAVKEEDLCKGEIVDEDEGDASDIISNGMAWRRLLRSCDLLVTVTAFIVFRIPTSEHDEEKCTERTPSNESRPSS